MYDFYILSALPTWGLKSSTRYVSDADELEFVTKDTLTKVCNYLQKDLIGQVFYALSCEFRHYFSFGNIQQVARNKNRKFIEAYLDHVLDSDPNPHAPAQLSAKELLDSQYTYFDEFINAAFFLKDYGRDISVAAIRKAGANPEQFAKIARDVFNESVWNDPYYGGKSWAAIAEGWLKLNSAKNLGDQIVYIDHIFDLQHNTGSVLTKCSDYADDHKNYGWIRRALNHKAKAKSLFDLTNKCTPSLKYFAARTIKAATGETFESYTKKKN